MLPTKEISRNGAKMNNSLEQAASSALAVHLSNLNLDTLPDDVLEAV
jgi:hypothetical protein